MKAYIRLFLVFLIIVGMTNALSIAKAASDSQGVSATDSLMKEENDSSTETLSLKGMLVCKLFLAMEFYQNNVPQATGRPNMPSYTRDLAKVLPTTWVSLAT